MSFTDGGKRNMPGRSTQFDLSYGNGNIRRISGWRSAAVGVGVFAFFSLIPTASAVPIAGSFSVANCGGGGVILTPNAITWVPAGTASGAGCIDTGINTNV